MSGLIVKDLHVEADGKEIVKGLSLEVKQGEVVAIMGPNGSGKSTLSFALMGHPKYKITKGQIFIDEEEITNLSADEKAKKGLFLSFQYPYEISGVTLSNFLRTAYNSAKEKKISVPDFIKLLNEKMKLLKIPEIFKSRYLNEGFSGGEKKKAEILQLSILQPKIAIIDEVDSGTDVDAMKIVAEGIDKLKKENNMGVLIITHYNRILELLEPDRVLILVDGKITKEGDHALARKIEVTGYNK